MQLPKTYVFWYARRIIDSLLYQLATAVRCFWYISIYISIAVFLLGVTAFFSIRQERKNPYNFSTKLFDVRSMQVGTYTSGDSTTDMIVNYFAGKQDLPLTLKAEILLYHELDICEKLINGKQDSFARAGKYLSSVYDTISIPRYIALKKSIGKPVEDHFSWIPDSVSRDALYYAVWKTYFESGAPLLEIRPDPHSVPSYYFGASMYYEPLQRKLYFQDPFFTDKTDFSWSLDNFLEELGHAKQFDERPWTSYISSTYGLCRTAARSLLCYAKKGRVRPLSDSYNREYTEAGSFEYEAHSVIGTELKNRCTEAMYTCIEDIGY